MNRRATYRRPNAQSWPRSVQAGIAAALVALAPLMGWLVLALYSPRGGAL